MQGQIPAARQRIIQRIATQAQRIRKRIGAISVEAFITAYYRGVAEQDLSAGDAVSLASAALAHLQRGQARRRNTTSLRVYSPDFERDAWRSKHSVVEVITDDMPFLVDSLTTAIARQELVIHLTVHPVLQVRRDAAGHLLEIDGETHDRSDKKRKKSSIAESWQRIEIDRLPDEAACAALERTLREVLDDVRLAVADWQAIRQRAVELAEQTIAQPPPLPESEAHECAALLQWLANNHFTFLGYREYRLIRGQTSDTLEPLPETSLGLLRSRKRAPRSLELAGPLRQRARVAEVLFITKANSISTVHRSVSLDYLGVKRFDKKGRVIGEHRFLGLFTSNVYQLGAREIPVLRAKLAQVIQRFGIDSASHDGKAVAHVLDTYPRDELFQTEIDELAETVRGIVNLYDRQQVRLFVRRDPLQRFYSCLVFVPRDRYNTQVRHRIEALVRERLNGTSVESQIQLSDAALARVHLLVRTRPEDRPAVNVAELEKNIALAIRTWQDLLRDALSSRYGESRGLDLVRQYTQAFPAAYQEDVSIDEALLDIEQLTPLLQGGDGLALRLVRGQEQRWRLRMLRAGLPIALSDALPLLENLGFRVLTERPYRIACSGERPIWIQEFELDPPILGDGKPASIQPDTAEHFREAYLAIDSNRAENDGFNRLVVASGLTWRSITVLRAYARYLLQTGLPFSQRYMEATLLKHSAVAATLWELFDAQFNPDWRAARNAGRNAVTTALTQRVATALDSIQAQDEDRILRAYLGVIGATLRTNYYQLDSATGNPKGYLSIKLHSQQVPDLPLPKPLYEIFVYSPRVEGVHLRMGQVARGGIRWSDRREDFRTEVLGLMKAQNVKNAVIVPMGAKGGFVPKQIPATASNDDRQREGVACYRTFIRGLLDITDNSVGHKIIPPQRVVRRDTDDPYLVVAADKGTATFSDIANSVAAEYNFWLGDAFASGGSAGYDHKKMAITARGAWECVKRHFRELGLDTQSQSFTVAGIGDMAGDVFGNGMLRSPHMRVVAAFNHQHIFLDPDPNASSSFRERQRLFALPRSSWEDYDGKLISPGGGVFQRSAKSIKLSSQVKTLLDIDDDALTPQALIRAILKAPVDLLWNGGIGTYVKASSESHSQAGDRGNDSVRVDGKELRCKVVGEGGNLGFTQLGRIEYALKGGRINTDFIDNSGGVDCSDHEVNIKILLNSINDRDLKKSARDKLLARMTEDVAALVLRDNFLQSQAISMLESSAAQRLQEHAHFIRSLELSDELDRTVEFLPSIERLAERRQAGLGLTRPELAVLLCYSKMWLYKRLLASNVPEDSYLSGELARYFPKQLQDGYAKLFNKHRLRREIIATATTNSLINRMGPSFALRAQEETGADIAQIARAYTIAREAFEMRTLWSQVEMLGVRTAATAQYSLLNESSRLLRYITYWLLHRHGSDLDIESQVSLLRPGLQRLRTSLPGLLSGAALERYKRVYAEARTQQLPEALADHLAQLDTLSSGPDIVELAGHAKKSVDTVAAVYFSVGSALALDWLHTQVLALRVEGRWQAIARTTLRDQLHGLQRELCLQILNSADKQPAAVAVDAWLRARQSLVEHVKQTVHDMRSLPAPDFATLSVAMQSLRQLKDA